MTITLNVQGLWDNWQRSQRDNNIHEPAVQRYVNMLVQHQALPAISIDGLPEEDGVVRIRTADGRHRITAAHRHGAQEIDAVATDISRYAKEVFGL